MKTVLAGLLAAACLVGCANSGKQIQILNTELIERDSQIRSLRRDLARLKSNALQQQDLIHTLRALGARRLENLFHVRRIRLGRYTGGYDTDRKPGHEGVKVYLEPLDAHGSTLKAAGEVTIQLFDLAGEGQARKLGEHTFAVEDMAKHWFSGALSYHYSFVCLWEDNPPQSDEITIRVKFVDYLTGKTHTAQKRVVVDVPPAPKATAALAVTAEDP